MLGCVRGQGRDRPVREVATTARQSVPRLSVVVIGRNEAEHLACFGTACASLRALPFPVQLVFVDSGSNDGSAEIAAAYFDQVVVLADHAGSCASSARRAGVDAANGDFVLHLDGDMTLCEEFLAEAVPLIFSDDRKIGLVGDYIDLYPDGGSRRYTVTPYDTLIGTAGFGGAVLLPRRALIEAGSWDASVYSNEELELLVRLIASGVRIRHVAVPMVRHETERLPQRRLVRNLFFPQQGERRKRFYGFGQLVRAALRRGDFLALVRVLPYLVFYWAGLSAAVVVAVVGCPVCALGLAAAGALPVVAKRGVRYLVIYLGFVPQLVLGFHNYRPDSEPQVLRKIGCA